MLPASKKIINLRLRGDKGKIPLPRPVVSEYVARKTDKVVKSTIIKRIKCQIVSHENAVS